MSSTMSRMKKDRFPFHYGRGKSGGTKLVQNYGVQSNAPFDQNGSFYCHLRFNGLITPRVVIVGFLTILQNQYSRMNSISLIAILGKPVPTHSHGFSIRCDERNHLRGGPSLRRRDEEVHHRCFRGVLRDSQWF